MLTLGDSKLVTLSIGGNDVLFGRILKSCIVGIKASECDNWLAKARVVLYGPTFWHEYKQVICAILEKTGWLSFPTNDRPSIIYQTGYIDFFDRRTSQCDTKTFSPIPGKSELVLSKILRRKLNDLTAEVK